MTMTEAKLVVIIKKDAVDDRRISQKVAGNRV
jgi:hypothetical protein